jgi:DNA mismatch endonuclease (patch repair protein)
MIVKRETMVVRESTSRSMRSNKGKDNKLEVEFRKALWAAGVRGYRKNVGKLPGRPDLVFRAKKLVVLVHGCFWHRCPKCKRDANFLTNEGYWRSKLDANVERDERNRLELMAQGFEVVEVWECEVRRNLGEAVGRVRAALGKD